jgi:hypothetical protein
MDLADMQPMQGENDCHVCYIVYRADDYQTKNYFVWKLFESLCFIILFMFTHTCAPWKTMNLELNKQHLSNSITSQSRTQSNACARARMALALGKLNFSCAMIGLTFIIRTYRQRTGTPKFRVVNFPRANAILARAQALLWVRDWSHRRITQPYWWNINKQNCKRFVHVKPSQHKIAAHYRCFEVCRTFRARLGWLRNIGNISNYAEEFCHQCSWANACRQLMWADLCSRCGWMILLKWINFKISKI